jgi:hypothetical protein
MADPLPTYIAQDLGHYLAQVIAEEAAQRFEILSMRGDLDALSTGGVVGASRGPAFVNVQAPPYNAVGDGVADDTAAIQAAMDSGQGQAVEVYFPGGTYKVMPHAAPSDSDLTLGHCLYLRYDNVTFQGAGRGTTTIKAVVRGDLDPVAHWDVTPSGAVRRGATFYLLNPGGGVARKNFEMSGLRVTGGTSRASSPNYPTCTAPVPFPPNPVDGDGWGGFHSAIMMHPGMTVDGLYLHDCEFDSYRAEILISQGSESTSKNFRVERCLIHDGLGNGMNFGASMVFADSEVHTVSQGMEIYHYAAEVTVEGCYFHDNHKGLSNGGNVPVTAPYGLLTIRLNRFERQYFSSIFILGFSSRIHVHDNDFVDEGYAGYGALLAGTLYGGTPSDLVVERNRVICDRRAVSAGFIFNSDAGWPIKHWVVRDNLFIRTAYAREHGYAFTADNALQCNPYNGDADELIVERNDTSDSGSANRSGANLLWTIYQDRETADTLAPTIRFRRQATVALLPTVGRSYSAWTLAPEDVPLVVKVGPNATIQNSATLKLTGAADFAPGGTGGLLTLIRPAGSAALYEVSRLVY